MSKPREIPLILVAILGLGVLLWFGATWNMPSQAELAATEVQVQQFQQNHQTPTISESGNPMDVTMILVVLLVVSTFIGSSYLITRLWLNLRAYHKAKLTTVGMYDGWMEEPYPEFPPIITRH